MDPKALFNITYGLYVLSARENDFDNACIINTAVQVANDPVPKNTTVGLEPTTPVLTGLK